MPGFLRPDTPFYNAWSQAADLVVVNVLTLVGCLPVVTAGASLTACARVTSDMARELDPPVARSWWRSFRGNLVQSLAWWVPVLLLGALGCYENLALAGAGEAAARTAGAVGGLVIAGAVLVAALLVWLLPLVGLFENTVGGHLANAARLAVGRLGLTAVCLIVVALPIIAAVLLPGARVAEAWFMVLIGVGLGGYLIGLVQRRTMEGLLDGAR